MKSVGEVMAIGRKFEEVLQKALRMLGVGLHGLVYKNAKINGNIDSELKNPTDKRVIVIAEAIKKSYSIDKIYSLSKIDKWFLYKIKNIVETEKEIKKCKINSLSKELLRDRKSVV